MGVRSSVPTRKDRQDSPGIRMEAIKKKMQAMKVEKDNLCDRCDEVEQEDKEAQVMAAEAEFNRLNRRVQELEEDLEITEADDSDRMAKVLANRAVEDEAKMKNLADELASAQKRAEEADRQYDEAQKKMQVAEASLEVNGERADVSEFKIIELEEELKVVANNLKSLEVSGDKANQRESFYKSEIKRLTTKLKQSETRSEFAEKSVVKLQKEVDSLEDELVNEQDKFKAITEELDVTFAEMSGY